MAQRGNSGAWVGDLLPYTAKIADRLTFIKTVNTEEINHDPAVTMCQTGFRLGGRPSMGAWISYGIGAETEDLPAFCVMISTQRRRPAAVRSPVGQRVSSQPLSRR